MTTNRQQLIIDLRAAADALEAEEVPGVALIVANKDGTVRWNYEVDGTFSRGAVLLGIEHVRMSVIGNSPTVEGGAHAKA